ncbi:hypothetical protein GCK72_016052 [Caenorhabditis remanei]|uniref:Tyrosyl-DNA phosphodiesterase n=1 Tax=Caenorhabditis remanei TaxID=31234 RepID=A0A6A5GYF7_CAERE|nr:hypothetical protein GCK72_016052 [Caenorhabditis remanei]KAF1759585.1 hypothetical protein GCK72_016052 [Caenorhabditis remanei]
MKRSIPSTSQEASTSQAKRVAPPILQKDSGEKTTNLKRKSVLESGTIYFTPIGGITVPLQESEGSRSLEDILADIRPISSLHMNFMIDFEFLVNSYPPSLRTTTPITLVVGAPDVSDLRKSTLQYPNVTVHSASLPIPFGTHHSKLSILESDDGFIHVIVSTANLISDDWEFKTQQFYYAMGMRRETEFERSPFQEDLIEYLSYYSNPLSTWKTLIESTDFSTVTDRLIFSTPGYHTDPQQVSRLGHPRLSTILSQKFPFDPKYEHTDRCTFIAQCSSIGSLGSAPSSWFRGQFLKSLEAANPAPKNKPPKMYLVFPCVEDVRNSCQGYAGGGSVPYRNSVHDRQKWLQDFMCKWRSNTKRRTKAVPHCKTYVKYDQKIAQWQLLTSANVSKAAWGEMSFSKKKNVDQLMIRSWEIGVLITDPSRFNIPFDYPCVPYSSTDRPFTTDQKHEQPDILGCVWNP